MTSDPVVRLTFRSHFDMVDFVQVVSDELGKIVGFDGDAIHWIGVAVRESVINAIKHGNRDIEDKLVTVEFGLAPLSDPNRLTVRVVDQGDGFDPVEIADPLAPENLLKSSGRGIFFMRSLMDDVRIRRAPEGGMEVVMVKTLQAASRESAPQGTAPQDGADPSA